MIVHNGNWMQQEKRCLCVNYMMQKQIECWKCLVAINNIYRVLYLIAENIFIILLKILSWYDVAYFQLKLNWIGVVRKKMSIAHPNWMFALHMKKVERKNKHWTQNRKYSNWITTSKCVPSLWNIFEWMYIVQCALHAISIFAIMFTRCFAERNKKEPAIEFEW